jgi:crotonobetainyl-CoA:carnitine CoA-transferase CaiB-like acyl-CoA transferase
MTAPLAGIRVVDLTRYVAGPLAAMTLGDLGADVIKVETLAGDPARESGPFVEGESTYFMASNHSKRAISLDLRAPEGMKVLLKLIDTADVFIENFRPGTADSMGLGPEALHARNPRLIHASISGFGNTDAARDLPGFDQTVQAMSGLMSVTGTEETGPMRVGIAVSDSSTGAFATVGILAALMERERTGKGTTVEASLLQSTMAIINYQAQIALSTGEAPGRNGNDHPILFPQGTFKVGTSAITIASGNEKMWRKLCGVLGLESLAEDPRYADNSGRVHHRKELRQIIEGILATRSADEWIETINAAGVPAGPVLDLREALNHPTTRALGLVQQTDHPRVGRMDVIGKAVTVGDDSRRIERHAPLLGEHSVEILDELGLSSGETASLLARGIVATPADLAVGASS